MKIIKDPEVLRSNYIPDKLLFRDELIKKIQKKIELGTGNILLGGDTGLGKTICVKKAVEKFGNKIIFNEINCSVDNSYTAFIKRNIENIKGKNYNECGKSRPQLAEDLKKILKTKREKKIVSFIDEVDVLIDKERNHQQVLLPLIENTNANIILASNRDGVFEKLQPNIRSRLQIEQEKVRRYSAEEIYEILLGRAKKSFIKGTYDLEVLRKISKIYFHTTGDLRDALSLLFQMAQIAEEKGKKITVDLLDEAQRKTEETGFDEIYVYLTDHQKVIIFCLTKLSLGGYMGYAEVKNLYNSYEKAVENHQNSGGRNLGKPVKMRQFEYLLKKLKLTGLIRSEFKSIKQRGGRESLIFPTFDTRKFMEKYYD